MSGDAVDSNAGSANVASLMRYTLSNIQEGSSKLWCGTAGAALQGLLPSGRALHGARMCMHGWQ